MSTPTTAIKEASAVHEENMEGVQTSTSSKEDAATLTEGETNEEKEKMLSAVRQGS